VNSGIEFVIIWLDQDLLECLVTCSNGSFSGQTKVYLTRDRFSEMADTLRGFPLHPTDFRKFEIGTFDPGCGGGGIRLHFRCTDSVGHAEVDVKLRGDTCKGLGELESVALRIPVEAAAIDSFVSQIGKMENKVGATAYLKRSN
jgi:hypothetical protein